MTEIRLLHLKPARIMEIVRELREFGLLQGHDFDFSYTPASYNNDGHEAVIPRHVVFRFHVEKWASWFVLKYSRE